ncbi:MAG TPA: OmpA family protein [Stellaceae bacterium]|nr:OmpA family protein [Stellaceae bacterium]
MQIFKRAALLVSIVGSAALLSACVSSDRYGYLENQFTEIQKQNQTMAAQNSADRAEISAIKQQMASDEQHIRRLQDAIKYTVNSDLLFPSGSWKMSAGGEQLIAKLAPQLAPYQQQKIVVNGYTDNAKVGAALRKDGVKTNEELSQKRADAVMAYLVSKGVNKDLVSAHGYGESDPIAPNDTAQGRSENRRVEIQLAE